MEPRRISGRDDRCFGCRDLDDVPVGADVASDIARERAEVDGLSGELERLPHAESGHLDELVQQRRHPRRGGVDPRERLQETERLRGRESLRSAMQQLREALDRCERISEIVRDGREKLIAGVHGIARLPVQPRILHRGPGAACDLLRQGDVCLAPTALHAPDRALDRVGGAVLGRIEHRNRAFD